MDFCAFKRCVFHIPALMAFAILGLAATAERADAVALKFEFEGRTGLFPGLLGPGGFSGSITIDSSLAVPIGLGAASFSDMITDVDIVLAGGVIRNQGTPTTNNVQQTSPGMNGRDNLRLTYSGGFAPTGGAAEIASIGFIANFASGVDIFSAPSQPLDELNVGDQFIFDDFSGVEFTVGYIGQSFGQATIVRIANFDELTATVLPSVAPIPLPAGLPIMASGLCLLGFMRLRKR